MALASRDGPADDELGARFDDVRVLLAGDRFTTYRVRQRDTRRAALVKVPSRSGGGWLADALDHEATVLAAIGTHPNVITLFERIALANGTPGLLLENCAGTLADELHSDGRLPAQSVVSIGIKVAGALETAHKAGFVHCEVRAQNVLVSTVGEPLLGGFDESVRINADPALHDATPHTAPELLEGRPATPRTDVYGLGSTLYELVAGRAAFRAYVGESPARVAARVLSGRVAPIVTPEVPLEVSDLLTWAMTPEPTGRPPAPAWMAEELGRIERRLGWPRTPFIAR